MDNVDIPSVADSHLVSRWLNRTMLRAGLTTALGDFCYETSDVFLPGFLAVLGIPVVALGTIEGVADAISSFTKLGTGYIANHLRHRKALVVAGYALTAIGQAFIAAAGWLLILVAGYPISRNVVGAALKSRVIAHMLMRIGAVAALVPDRAVTGHARFAATNLRRGGAVTALPWHPCQFVASAAPETTASTGNSWCLRSFLPLRSCSFSR